MTFRPILIALMLVLVSGEAFAIKGPKANLIDERWLEHDPASVTKVDHGAWARFLDAYLVAGNDGINRVRYGAVSASDKAGLDAYVAALEATEVSALNRDEQVAYWINLYNALTVKIVIEAYPVSSIRKVLSGGFLSPGPWNRDLVTVEGHTLSLNDIEHGILRPIWQDNRIHYALNCASIGCPNLAARPFSTGSFNAMLNAAARDYINHPRGVSVSDRGKVKVSRIYNWYDVDFGGNVAGVMSHIRRFATPALHQRLETAGKISGYHYDWSLNEARQAPD